MTRVIAFPPLFAGPVVLAPMAGITDLPFRRMVARFGAGMMTSEMVSAAEITARRPSPRAQGRARAELEAPGGIPVSVQIAGREAGALAEAARVVAGLGARAIDVNMGCPARKVTGGLAGAALMRAPDEALRLLGAVQAAVPDLPVSVKMRLGWDDACLTAGALALGAARQGAAMIAVHGRTRAQFYGGAANWAAIGGVGATLAANLPAPPPLVANGDITDAASARAAMAASGAAAVMVGRGAQGAPWRLAQIDAALRGAPEPARPPLAETVAEHHDAILSHYGADPGLRVARKHLGWYAEAAGLGARRAELTGADTPAAARAAIRAVFA